jgi:hypothetical protein
MYQLKFIISTCLEIELINQYLFSRHQTRAWQKVIYREEIQEEEYLASNVAELGKKTNQEEEEKHKKENRKDKGAELFQTTG